MSQRPLVALSAVSLVAACLACASTAFAQVTVQLRGGAPDRTASGATALDQGLEVRLVEPGKPETREVIPWDEVRGISDSSGRNPATDYLAMAEDLWRARIRVARRDAALASPLLERHWARLRGARGPTAQLVAEGLLRAAVESRDLNGAVGPWIACLRLGTEGTPSRFPALTPLLDDSTGLLPGLSPFVPSDMRPALAKALDEAAAHATSLGSTPQRSAETAASVATQMSRLLAISGAGALPSGSSPASTDAPAVRVLAAIEAIAAATDARTRERAVDEFDRLYPEAPAFLSAWRLAAIGAGSARAARSAAPDDRMAALLAAALDNLAVPASGLDKTGLVDAYAIEVAEQLTREAGDTAAANALAGLREERLRDAAIKISTTPAASGEASTEGSTGTTQ
ncbi:MAG: hypothetical protein RLY21_305 [Planctomycetota bacterium]|jgi:hypothetical protein